MAAENVTGILHVSINPKIRRTSIGNMLALTLLYSAVEEGRISYDDRRWFYAPRFWLHELHPEGRRRYLWNLAGKAGGLTVGDTGRCVTVRGIVEPWSNGLGARVTRTKVVELGPPTKHVCDVRGCPTRLPSERKENR